MNIVSGAIWASNISPCIGHLTLSLSYAARIHSSTIQEYWGDSSLTSSARPSVGWPSVEGLRLEWKSDQRALWDRYTQNEELKKSTLSPTGSYSLTARSHTYLKHELSLPHSCSSLAIFFPSIPPLTLSYIPGTRAVSPHSTVPVTRAALLWFSSPPFSLSLPLVVTPWWHTARRSRQIGRTRIRIISWRNVGGRWCDETSGTWDETRYEKLAFRCVNEPCSWNGMDNS